MPFNSYDLFGDCPNLDELDFMQIIGHESLSRPSFYELRLISINKYVETSDILGRLFTVVIYFKDKSGAELTRHFTGYATRVTVDINFDAENSKQYTYKVVLESWFGLLKKRQNSRIFQDTTLRKIIEDVYADSPIKRVAKSDYDLATGIDKEINFCVQFQETDYDFISRLLEKEGIHYWFDTSTAEKTGTMFLANEIGGTFLPAGEEMTVIEAGKSTGEYNELTSWNIYDGLGSGKYASRDSDYKSIRKKLEAGKSDPRSAELNDLAELEIFEFAGGYTAEDDIKKIEDIRINELASRNCHYSGVTSWPDVRTGGMFCIKSNEESDTYCIATCTFVVTNPDYVTSSVTERISINAILGSVIEKDAILADDPTGYRNLVDFMGGGAFKSAVPGTMAFFITVKDLDNSFRPARLTPRNMMPGPQSAIVVGPNDDEIHADELGRVRVHFHWDRYKDISEKTSCWIRVSQPWAGKGWGGYFIPRVGQEVIVDFLNGDPDRPIIVGRMYNDDQPIPFDSHTQSGFKTRSTPKGNTKTFNELRFDDKKSAEQVYVHAERNLDIEVEANETRNVGHDRKKIVGNDETTEVKNNRTEKVGGSEKIDITNNRTETVGANEKITITASRTEKVGTGEKVTIGLDREHNIGANDTLIIASNKTEIIGASATQTITGSLTQTIGSGYNKNINGAYTQIVNGPVLTVATGPVTFIAPAGFNVIAPGGTTVVDFKFMKIGGTLSENYAGKLDFNGFAVSVNGLKSDTSAVTNSNAALKADSYLFKKEAVAFKKKDVPATITNNTLNITMTAILIIM